MKEKLEKIIFQLLGTDEETETLSGIYLPEQFIPEEESDTSIARNINSAFLIMLSGKPHPLYCKALQYLEKIENDPSWNKCVSFYREAINLITTEISERCHTDKAFRDELDRLYSWISEPEKREDRKGTIDRFHRVFFPEGVLMSKSRKEKITSLRKRREITISRLNPSPIENPAKELLMTSNILLTIPSAQQLNDPDISISLKEKLGPVTREEQAFWYDHPVPVGILPEHNEVLHGLQGLDNAAAFEKEYGTIGKDEKVTCILSVSVTHEGLHGLAKEYIEDALGKENKINNLNLYVFTEADTELLIRDILIPAAKCYNIPGEELLYEIFGVDGEYGRHFSFLKAIAAFWQVFIDPYVKGTFKIDLDQVFPQEELLEFGGTPAFGYFRTPLWGAEGSDIDGNSVELGMIAGALVNQKDIGSSLYTPDVPFPSEEIEADNLFFFSNLPQAISTEAEMMTRYGDGPIDGKTRCIQRIHVTGGTSGILIESLRRHRPFTPTFIGRAEDQAYILSVLFSGKDNNLRYFHSDGLIMRHDKDAFAGDAVKAASIGKLIGDYVRILLFSYYIKSLPWSIEKIKDTIDPFTGCFVSRIPLTVVYLRFALKAAILFTGNKVGKNLEGYEFVSTGSKRLHKIIGGLVQEPNPLLEQFKKETAGWKAFYKILKTVEDEIRRGDAFALELKKKADRLVKKCRIMVNR